MVVGAVISNYGNMVKIEKVALHNSDLKIYGIISYRNLYRIYTCCKVAVVLVKVGNIVCFRIAIILNTFLKQNTVVNLSFLYSQYLAQLAISKNTISYKSNISEIVFIAFFQFNVNRNILFVKNSQRITNDTRIAVAVRFVFFQN